VYPRGMAPTGAHPSDRDDTMKDEEITSEHTCARIGQLLGDLEALRLEMGRSRDARISMHAREVSPREVFYHAVTVHRKANQLCVELGAPAASPPQAVEPARARPADVLRVLDSVGERLAQARAHLGLDEEPGPAPSFGHPRKREEGKTASDVLEGCLIASRQLNVMLEHAFTSKVAHERLIRALGLTEQLLAVHGLALPVNPPLVRRKFPRDVFEVLWRACDVLHHLLTDSGLTALDLRRGYVGEEPSDVYDMASLLVSELEYVASFLPTSAAPLLTAATPSPTLPAHNFRRALQLEAAFGALAAAVRAKPDWLPKARS
jgi:hypothetical protein